MFRFLSDRLQKVYYRAVNSIAFAPAIISLLLGALSILLLYFPDNWLDRWLSGEVSLLQSLEVAAARNMLAVITAGSISITVFSFSMVMLVMSQASTIYTPKILDGLTRDKRPQRILGIYIGTVLFCLPQLLLLNETKRIPLTAMLIAIVLMMLNMFVFIAFIDYVSRSVKPAVICRRIYLKVSRSQYKKTEGKEGWEPIYDQNNSHDFEHKVNSRKSGYLQHIDNDVLMSLCEKHSLHLAVKQRQGQFVLDGTPLLEITGLPEDHEELEDELHSAFFYSDIEDIEDNAYYAYRQLTDIAVKAMSPGINDIGTARLAIDFLIDLLSAYASNKLPQYLQNSSKNCSISFQVFTLHDLFELCLDEIRLYSTADKHVMLSLMRGCLILVQKDPENNELINEVQRFSDRLLHNLRHSDSLEFSEYVEQVYNQELKHYLH